MSEPLSEEEDAFGRLLLDYLAGEVGQLILELDDGRAGPASRGCLLRRAPRVACGNVGLVGTAGDAVS